MIVKSINHQLEVETKKMPKKKEKKEGKRKKIRRRRDVASGRRPTTDGRVVRLLFHLLWRSSFVLLSVGSRPRRRQRRDAGYVNISEKQIIILFFFSFFKNFSATKGKNFVFFSRLLRPVKGRGQRGRGLADVEPFLRFERGT